jgi:hypothetical protein
MAISRQIDFLLSGLIDSSGMPLSGGKVYTYSPGTTTPKTTWTDQAKTSPATNPITLNSLGQALIYGDGSYKFEIKKSDLTLLTTIDNINVNENSGAGAWINWTPTLSGGSMTFTSIDNKESRYRYISSDTIQFETTMTYTLGGSMGLTFSISLPIASVVYSINAGFPMIMAENGTNINGAAWLPRGANLSISKANAAVWIAGAAQHSIQGFYKVA